MIRRIFHRLVDSITRILPTLSHVKIPGKNFNNLSNRELASMIRALYSEGGNDDFDQWALIEFHSIRKFGDKRIQKFWNDINVIFTRIENQDDGWKIPDGKRKLLALGKELMERADLVEKSEKGKK